MEFEYSTKNGWAIYRQDDLFSSDTSWFTIYRYYDESGWMPYKQMGFSLKECFSWLKINNLISADEMKEQISLTEQE